MSTIPPPLRLVLGVLGVAALAGHRPARADDPAPPPRPTITIRAVRPDLEAAAVIGLCRGSRAASPAAALAAWKRASAEPKRLGKAGDAAIAIFNPLMVREFRALNNAELAIGFVPGPTRWGWRARFPDGDSTIDVVGPVADLSGGGIDPPIGDYRVDRFPGNSGAVLARGPAGAFAASSRDQLAAALVAARTPIPAPPIDSGWLVRVDPAASESWTSAAGRRWAEAARGTGCRLLTGRARLQGTTAVAAVTGRFDGDTPVVPAVDPDWLDPIPTRGPLAAFGFRVDPRPAAWDRLFALVDRVERADPARANVAPARVRLALLARAFGVRLEADLWPHLQGVSGWVGAAGGKVDRAVLALHLDGDEPARLVAAGIKGGRKPDGPDEAIDAGAVAGRPLRVIRRRGSVFLAWGEHAWAESRAAIDQPDRSARPWLAASRTGALPSRVGAVWLDQVPLVPPGSPLAASLAEGPPLRWAGANEGNRSLDEFWVDGLDATVRRFLDRLPFDPPPEPGPTPGPGTDQR